MFNSKSLIKAADAIPLPVDLKQVAGLFTSVIAGLRKEAASADMDTLAVKCLRDARCQLMREVEQRYHLAPAQTHDILHPLSATMMPRILWATQQVSPTGSSIRLKSWYS